MKVFVVLDMDAKKKDCIEGIYVDKDHAIESAAILKDMRVGGAKTRIQIHDVHYAHSCADQFRERLEKMFVFGKPDIEQIMDEYNEIHQ